MESLKARVIGDTIVVFDESSKAQVDAMAKSAMERGQTVLDADSRQWIETKPIINEGCVGSDAFIWDNSGNKVKHSRTLVRVVNGVRTEADMKPVFKSI